MRRTITFESVKRQGVKSGVCVGCGKRKRRTLTFEHTINPFNKHPDGTPKNRSEVFADVLAAVKAWEAEPMECAACQDKRTHAEWLAKAEGEA